MYSNEYSFPIMVKFIPETVGSILVLCWKYRCIPEIINTHACELFYKIWLQKIIMYTELNNYHKHYANKSITC